MNVKIGDYFIDQFGFVFHVINKRSKEVANANRMAVRLATEEEIEEFHKEMD